MKYIEIMRATPNNANTFDIMNILAHTLTKRDGEEYFVIINFKKECVILYKVVD